MKPKTLFPGYVRVESQAVDIRTNINLFLFQRFYTATGI